jgi:hypothetical protein
MPWVRQKPSVVVAGAARYQKTIAPFSLSFLMTHEASVLVSADRASIWGGARVGTNSRCSACRKRVHMGPYESRSIPATDPVGFADELVDAGRTWREMAEMVTTPSVRSIVLDKCEWLVRVADDPHG